MFSAKLTVFSVFVFASSAFAEPFVLSDGTMDRITAGDLTTPATVVFSGFDNAAPGTFHPAFNRDDPVLGDGGRRSPQGSLSSGNNEGPWSAHFNSPVIVCNQC